LEWVKKNAHLFGGDPSRVTVMGESAGGGSLLHQVTAYGGERGAAPFEQAIIQSPAWVPIIGENTQEATLQQFLRLLNVSTIEEARTLPSEKLIAANSKQIALTPNWGSLTYGPTVDGTFVPALPGQLLLQGKFDHNLNVMVGHAADEGLLFTTPESYNSSGLPHQLSGLAPNITPKVFNYILDVLYPPVYNGTYPYTDSVSRAALVVSDMCFQCNTDYINRAFEKTYAYVFDIPPALHGQDGSYTFYNSGDPVGNSADLVSALSAVSNVTTALAMQDYFLSFSEKGVPESTLAPKFEPWGPRGQLMSIDSDGIHRARDPTNNARCRFWQTAPYYTA
jgi:carboxylesterase type B